MNINVYYGKQTSIFKGNHYSLNIDTLLNLNIHRLEHQIIDDSLNNNCNAFEQTNETAQSSLRVPPRYK